MPEGPAKLGYFVSKDQTIQNADNVCVLVVHYNFENTKDESWIREGDAQDVENLDKTFRVNRNCNFRSILSPEKGQLLELLSDHEKLLGKFGCTDVPSVFVLYILSHGDRDGKIFTDHYQEEDSNDFICFTTAEIFESLKKLTGFEDCLKLINFGPCRGELIDTLFYENDEDFKNENSCRITYSPMIRNMVMFFSTVETTKAKRDQKGTTFALLTCKVLNSLDKDESLINVLTTIQYESHKIAGKEKTGQTPEVKMFSQDRSFVFSKNSKDCSSLTTFEATSFIIQRKREFYSWKSSSGENLRHRLAFLISAKPNEQFKEIKRALSRNLDFETRERMLRGNPWVSINEASRIDPDIGCIFLIFFGQVSENKVTNEVCVEVDSKEIAVSEILLKFIGPKNDQWIGKPKVLFLVNQETSSFDNIGSRQSNMEISATNHSGWLVLVLHSEDGLQKLIEIFKGPELKKEKSLQEVLATLLISDSTENRDMLNSTLQYLLNFPDWPRSFVELSFSVKKPKKSLVEINFSVVTPQKSRNNQVSFDSLVRESATEKQIWLLSSVAGTGKTTILREMAFQLGKLNPELKILRISLPRVSFSSLKRNMSAIEFLANVTHNSHEEIIKSIESKQCVVILDGFDEIRPVNQEKILKVVEALEKEEISVWMGTRPNAAEAIQERIKDAVLVEIDPLNDKQQIALLKLEAGKSEDECELFIKNFKSKDILKNPLHLSLVANYGAEGNLYQIYDQVVRQKVEDSLIKEGFDKTNENIFPGKLNAALKRLQQIASCRIRGVQLNGGNRKDLEKINCYGIATVENNKVLFIHQTFAEFLAAQHFLCEIDDVGESQTSTEDCASVFQEQSSSSCIKFVDLFYSTCEEMIEEHKESYLPVMKLNPDRFLNSIVYSGCINIFKMIYQNITFSANKEGNCISVAKDRTLLVKSIDEAEEIAIMMLDTDLIDSDEELLTIFPYLLKAVAEANACHFFEKLSQHYPRLPEMIHSTRFFIDVGILGGKKNCGEILNLLLQSGVDVDFVETDTDGGNTLYTAISKGDKKCVEILLKRGAKLAMNALGECWDPLVLAVKENHLDLVKLLLEEDISGLQRNKETLEIIGVKTDLNAFHLAIEEEHIEIAKFLIEMSPSLKNMEICFEGSPLQYSAKKGYLKMCQMLVDEAGVAVNTLRPSGEPRDWSLDDNICMDHFLILQKDDINMNDERGKTALHCAAEYGYLERVQELINAGANIRAQDKHGWNAFHFACKSNSEHKEQMIRLLHSTDSQLAKEKTKSGETGLHILLKFSNCHSVEKVRFLVDVIEVDVRAEDDQGCTALHLVISIKEESIIDYLMTKDFNLEVENRLGQTCMQLAPEREDLRDLQTSIVQEGDLDVVDEEGSSALHYAAKRGYLKFVKKLLACAAKAAKKPDVSEGSVGSTLKKKERVNRCDHKGRTALHLAAETGNVDIVEILLEHNADLIQTDLEGKNAMHYAINNERMLRFINEKNGDLVKQRTNDGNTILHLALERPYNIYAVEHVETDDQIAQWIIEQVDDTILNTKNASGETPLLLACKREKWSVAVLLLTRNVEVNVLDTEGKTAMHYAAEKGNLNLVMLMHEKGADLTLTDSEGKNTTNHVIEHLEEVLFPHEKKDTLLIRRLKDVNTALQMAVGHNRYYDATNANLSHVEFCESDLNETSSEGETQLLLACKKKQWHIANILLAKTVDIDAKDKEGRTALHYAVDFDENEKADYSYAFDLVQELCNKGADLALTDNDGLNAFHHAIKNFHVALLLHELNGDLVKQRLNNGDTTLHLAIKLYKIYNKKKDNILPWLVEQCENDLNVQNSEGETPLLLACKEKKWNMAKILVAKTVDIHVKDKNGRTALHYALKLDKHDSLDDSHAFDLMQEFCKRGADLALIDTDGKNAFHHALTNYRMALLIHKLNGDLVKQRLNNGDTSLHLAIKLDGYWNYNFLIWLVEQCENDVNATNSDGETPLLLACKMNKKNIAKILLTKNVDILVKDKNGRTALHYAVKLNLHDQLENSPAFNLVQELCKRGADLASTDNDGMNALHHTIKNDHMTSYIHELNGDLVKQRLNNGDTTLHLAARCWGYCNTTKIILWLVERCPLDLNVKNNEGDTPLLVACKDRRVSRKIAKILLDKTDDIDVKDKYGRTALHYALIFLEIFDKQGGSPAFDLVQELYNRGADLALTNNDGMNAFHLAITNNAMALFIHNLNGDLVKQRLFNGDTSLHLAFKLPVFPCAKTKRIDVDSPLRAQ